MELATLNSIVTESPENPIFAFRPAILEKTAKYFRTNFDAEIIYAVKTNPENHIINGLHQCGVHCFDVASLNEIKQLKTQIPDATLFFMHPVKSPKAIKEAYFTYNTRHFSLDCEDELNKILVNTNNADDLNLHLRLNVSNSFSELSLADKFGIDLPEAPALLQKMRAVAEKIGVTFHVGSQCMHPDAYRTAMRIACQCMEVAEVEVDFFNVGGGFPSLYPGMTPPAMDTYFNAIHEEFAEIKKTRPNIKLLSEPGRALVAESTSLVVTVLLRKNNTLYINDGTYGTLFDAGTPKFIFPMRKIGIDSYSESDLIPFSFYGPTCDSLDFMKGPFYLPKDIKAGDYIEVGQMGAYGRTLSTNFNGFEIEPGVVNISDKPILSMYDNLFMSEEL